MLSQVIERKKEEQRKLLQDIQRINEENLLAKEHKKEEERLADLRAIEYTTKKLVRKVFLMGFSLSPLLTSTTVILNFKIRGRLFL